MTNSSVKPFKSGNSLAIRITKKDSELLGLTEDTIFDKVISPDGKSITFKKKEAVPKKLDQFIDDFYQKNGELMTELENL